MLRRNDFFGVAFDVTLTQCGTLSEKIRNYLQKQV
jgi:hypothetical protein